MSHCRGDTGTHTVYVNLVHAIQSLSLTLTSSDAGTESISIPGANTSANTVADTGANTVADTSVCHTCNRFEPVTQF